MSNEPDIQTRIRLRLVDWTDGDADGRALVERAGTDLGKLRDLYKEYLDEDGGCDHEAAICACGDYSYLEEADVALGLACWCDCSQPQERGHRNNGDACAKCNGVCRYDEQGELIDGEPPCDKCGMTGIIYFAVGGVVPNVARLQGEM